MLIYRLSERRYFKQKDIASQLSTPIQIASTPLLRVRHTHKRNATEATKICLKYIGVGSKLEVQRPCCSTRSAASNFSKVRTFRQPFFNGV